MIRKPTGNKYLKPAICWLGIFFVIHTTPLFCAACLITDSWFGSYTDASYQDVEPQYATLMQDRQTRESYALMQAMDTKVETYSGCSFVKRRFVNNIDETMVLFLADPDPSDQFQSASRTPAPLRRPLHLKTIPLSDKSQSSVRSDAIFILNSTFRI